MNLHHRDFTLYPGLGSDSWEVYRNPKAATNKKGRGKLIGYYPTLKMAINKIIEVLLAENKATVSLSEFLVAYTQEGESLVKSFNELRGV